jgi:hypothetical protein
LAFLNGNGLWSTPSQYTQYVPDCAHDSPTGATISDECETYLLANDKAAEQWRLEGKLIQFESRY